MQALVRASALMSERMDVLSQLRRRFRFRLPSGPCFGQTWAERVRLTEETEANTDAVFSNLRTKSTKLCVELVLQQVLEDVMEKFINTTGVWAKKHLERAKV